MSKKKWIKATSDLHKIYKQADRTSLPSEPQVRSSSAARDWTFELAEQISEAIEENPHLHLRQCKIQEVIDGFFKARGVVQPNAPHEPPRI